MNPENKHRLLTWMVILLAIINTIVITCLWVGHKNNDRPEPPRPPEFLAKELNMTDSQRNALHQLADIHHSEVEKIRKEVKTARDHYFDLLRQPHVSDSIRNIEADTIAMHLKDLDVLTFEHFKKVRALCTPQQQQRFDQIINEVLRMVAGPPPPPPPGHPGGKPPQPPGE